MGWEEEFDWAIKKNIHDAMFEGESCMPVPTFHDLIRHDILTSLYSKNLQFLINFANYWVSSLRILVNLLPTSLDSTKDLFNRHALVSMG